MARTQGSHSDLTRPRIREAALQLFAQRGYAAVSMRQIASEVGVQAGALYNYTPDKQALLFDLMQGHMQALLEARAQVQRPKDAISALEGFTRFHLEFHLDRPEAVFIAYMELRNLSEENFVKIEALRDQYESELIEILRNGQIEGQFDLPDVHVAARAVIAMLTGVTTWYRDSGALSRAEVEDMYWSMVLKAVRR